MLCERGIKLVVLGAILLGARGQGGNEWMWLALCLQ